MVGTADACTGCLRNAPKLNKLPKFNREAIVKHVAHLLGFDGELMDKRIPDVTNIRGYVLEFWDEMFKESGMNHRCPLGTN